MKSERDTYHHGDLRAALIAAGYEQAAAGGPDAVVIREVARTAGVSPTAAYRHFADRNDLLCSVGEAARDAMADVMQARIDELPRRRDPKKRAVEVFRATGTGYVQFAREQPGLFAVMFAGSGAPTAAEPDRAFSVLMAGIAGLAEAGVIPPERSQDGWIAAWSAVHGFATLRSPSGPLAVLPEADAKAAERSLLDSVLRALQ